MAQAAQNLILDLPTPDAALTQTLTAAANDLNDGAPGSGCEQILGSGQSADTTIPAWNSIGDKILTELQTDQTTIQTALVDDGIPVDVGSPVLAPPVPAF